VGKYSNLAIQPGYPKAIEDEFSGAPSGGNFDATLFWGHNRQLYLFRGSLYWKFNFDKGSVESGYPKYISKRWVGVPGNLTAAVTWINDKAYFFKGGNYYRFDDETLAVSSDPRVRYPRTTGKWWLGCDKTNFGEELEREENKPNVVLVPGDGDDGSRQPRESWIWDD
jgi:matrix metalloproteinase-14 (membrane-inserted)